MENKIKNNNYFNFQSLRSLSENSPDAIFRNRQSLEFRRFRKNIFGFSQNSRNLISIGLHFSAGDVLFFTFEKGPVSFSFEGVCLSVRNRNFGRKQTSLVTRNVISGVGIEITICYFLRRLYKLTFSDYKRKHFFYNRPRLYYLRNRLNKESRVRQ